MPELKMIAVTVYEKEQLLKVRAYIDSHLNETLAADELALQWDMSLYKLKAGFVHLTGKSFRNYIKARRMEKAKELLLTSNKIVYEIAIDCGYRDETSFSRAFKNYYGEAPKNFRRH